MATEEMLSRASVLCPQELSDEEVDAVPAPPPIDNRPRNASYENLERKLDAMEILAREQDLQRRKSAAIVQASKNKRASVLVKQNLEFGIDVPLPPSEPRPRNADDYNYQQEIMLREQLLKEKKRGGATSITIDEEDVPFPLPRHKLVDIQDRAVITKSFAGMSIEQLSVQAESALFSTTSLQRALAWMPLSGDVIVSAAPRCGQSLVVQLVRLLCADSDENFEEIINTPSRSAPWVECSLVDEDPDVIQRRQPGSNRVFRTMMTHSMLSAKIINCPEARFIAVFRNPLDMRLAWFDDMRRFYAKHEAQRRPGVSEEEMSDEFLSRFTPDDIADSPVTLAQNTAQAYRRPECEYEFNMRDWMTIAHGKENCLVLFIEELLASPEATLQKIAKFIGRELEDELMCEKILNECTGIKMAEISRRNSGFLTPEQESMIKLKFGKNEEVPVTASYRPMELLQRMESSNNSVSTRGIFAELARQNNDASVAEGSLGPRKSVFVSALQFIKHQDFSQSTVSKIRERWQDAFLSKAISYEILYESVTKTKYPSLRASELSSSDSRLRKHNSSAERPTSKKLINLIFKSGDSSEGTSPTGESNEALDPSPRNGRRKTLVGRILSSVMH